MNRLPLIKKRRRTRPRRPIPPPLPASPEMLAAALLELSESDEWTFLNGKSLRD